MGLKPHHHLCAFTSHSLSKWKCIYDGVTETYKAFAFDGCKGEALDTLYCLIREFHMKGPSRIQLLRKNQNRIRNRGNFLLTTLFSFWRRHQNKTFVIWIASYCFRSTNLDLFITGQWLNGFFKSSHTKFIFFIETL